CEHDYPELWRYAKHRNPPSTASTFIHVRPQRLNRRCVLFLDRAESEWDQQSPVPAISQANLFTPGAPGLRMGDSWPEKDFPMLRAKADAPTRQLAMRIRRGAFS